MRLEHEEVPLLAFQVVVDLADMRVVELRQDACLAREARLRLRVQPPLVDGLEGDPALQLLVETGVDRTHAATGQEIDDADMPDALA